jgi:holo-[acyl-carrier protein] synthase
MEVFRRRRKAAAYLAKRFAAKEALSKALGTGIHHPVNWHNVWVVNNRSGEPSFEFSQALRDLLERRGVEKVHLSLTDEIGMACAFVVLEGANRPAEK